MPAPFVPDEPDHAPPDHAPPGPDPPGPPALHPLEAAARDGRYDDLVGFFPGEGPLPSQALMDRALRQAVWAGHEDCVHALLAVGANPLGCEGTLGDAVLSGDSMFVLLLTVLALRSREEALEVLLTPEGQAAVRDAAHCALRPGLAGAGCLAALLLFLRSAGGVGPGGALPPGGEGPLPELLRLVAAEAAGVIGGAVPAALLGGGPAPADANWAPAVFLLQELAGVTRDDAAALLPPGDDLGERVAALEARWGGQADAGEMAEEIEFAVRAVHDLAFGAPLLGA